MAVISLKKLLKKKDSPFEAVQNLLGLFNEPLRILDVNGEILLSDKRSPGQAEVKPSPILIEGDPAGWVAGGSDTRLQAGVAALISALLSQEKEKKALAAEVLDKYRELSLLYRLSERLVAAPKPDAIARMALDEICPLIQTTAGMVVLEQAGKEEPALIASCGCSYRLRADLHVTENIVERTLHTGAAEVSNHLPSGAIFENAEAEIISMICAPLKTEERVFGAMILVGEPPRQFTAGDLKLVNAIAMQASPAIEIAHLHQVTLEKARLEHDLQVARQVQSGLLPRHRPQMEGWQVSAYWQPARTVSGDFYDFIQLPNGKLGLVIGDVSGKGMPAALVMANTRSTLRAVVTGASRIGIESPGDLLHRANGLLCEDMPPNMFVTCQLMILDPKTGRITFANAGHNLPYQLNRQSVLKLRATGLPLGLLPDMVYEDRETLLTPGDSLLLYSDGLVEAHNEQGEMFGNERLCQALETPRGEATQGEEFLQSLMTYLSDFTGPDWEQEDDVTLLLVERNH